MKVPFALAPAAAMLGAVLSAAPALAHDVKLDVDRSGLKYTDACSVEVYAVGRGQDPEAVVARTENVARGVDLERGAYEAVIACPSTEGTFRQTEAFRVRGDTTVRVTMKPAFVVADVIRNGVDVPATIRIRDERGRLLVKGRDKVAHPVPPGKLTVRALVDKKAAGRRKPVRGEAVVRTRVGQKATPKIDTSDGKILIDLRANGKKADGVGALRHPGELERLVEITAGEETPVPPGTYELVTALYESHDYHEVVTKGVVVEPRELERVRVSHPVGSVTPDVRLEGKEVPDDLKVEVDLYLGEAPRAFNTIAKDETAKLRPGVFRLQARVTNKKLDDGTDWEVDDKARVRAGRSSSVRLDLAPARLEVRTSLGGHGLPTEAQVLLPDSTAPIAKRRSGKDAPATFALKPGTYRARSVLVTPQGEHEVEQTVRLKKGRTKTVSLDHELGRAVVQVFDEGIAVPAEVSFVADGAAAPALRIKAGREAYLAPGGYTLIVHRGDREQSFSAIKVAPGRLVERQLELTVGRGEEKGKR